LTKLLTITRPGNDGEETIQALTIESIRPSTTKHTPEANSIVRMCSGRELAVVDEFDDLVELWDRVLQMDKIQIK
jgi:hypothetical protein